ncbi:SCO4402 family protein [Streptomyces lasiicapitis]|uniref:SCO4402 family protein n=1 Tax=Streptomyces lasiicapitis TaxID=1923961 RepID=UPI003645FB21
MEQAVTARKDVKLPEMRAEVISAVQALASPEYQQKVWIDRTYPHPDYYDDFTLNVHILYDDTTVLASPEAALGNTLTSEQEVSAMKKLAHALDAALDDVGADAPDTEFLQSPLWPQVVAAAQAALTALGEPELHSGPLA